MLIAFLLTMMGLALAGLSGYLIGRKRGRHQVAPVAELVADLQTVEVHQDTDGTIILLRLINPQTEGWDFMTFPIGPVSVRVDP